MNPSSLKLRRTGKLLLLAALVCAGQLYGMENLYESLPSELKQQIINTALETSDTLNEAVKTIKKLSVLHNIRYDNFKEMAALVNALTNKFPDESEVEITKALESSRLIELRGEWKMLPNDVKVLILMALAQSGDELEESVHNIKKVSLVNRDLNKMLNDLKEFTKIVHIIADKFDNLTSHEVADEFDTSIAKQYIEINESLVLAILSGSPSPEKVIKLLNQGADVNFCTGFLGIGYGGYGALNTPLTFAVRAFSPELVKLLLDAGANPFFKLPNNGMTALDLIQNTLNQHNLGFNLGFDETSVNKLQRMKTLLEEAMRK